ncbi:hypothetical protein X770_05605 [Mesorhizobium sp. LSJC269B00]|uniref:hypothetical protein n=1 Tax=Mesorhizobium sp. LSJC269B00 TaxID=1287326 RepID=UPI0003CE49B3|nr:hypothetical protein [Mesorhizobium sp. LSJC269B00]ESW92438.1 hypothetical protein X770_05605 [Mesorhizobium sp. LSJC269B00]
MPITIADNRHVRKLVEADAEASHQTLNRRLVDGKLISFRVQPERQVSGGQTLGECP